MTKAKYNWVKPSEMPYFYIPCPVNGEELPILTLQFYDGQWIIKILNGQKSKVLKGTILNDIEMKKLAVKEFKSYIHKLNDIANEL